MLQSLGVSFTEKETQEVFALVDTDGGGEIDVDEFETWFNESTQPRRFARRGSLAPDIQGFAKGGMTTAAGTVAPPNAGATALRLAVAQTKESHA